MDVQEHIQMLEDWMKACPEETREHWEPSNNAMIYLLMQGYKWCSSDFVVIEDGKRLIARLIWKEELGNEDPVIWEADILLAWNDEKKCIEEYRPDPLNPARYSLYSLTPPTKH